MEEKRKCSRCGSTLKPEEVYVYKASVFCEDCLMRVGLAKRQCDPWRLAHNAETSSRKANAH